MCVCVFLCKCACVCVLVYVCCVSLPLIQYRAPNIPALSIFYVPRE